MVVWSAAVMDARLIDAAKRNDPAAIRASIKQNVDVNAVAAEGATALHWAAEWDDVETELPKESTARGISGFLRRQRPHCAR